MNLLWEGHFQAVNKHWHNFVATKRWLISFSLLIRSNRQTTNTTYFWMFWIFQKPSLEPNGPGTLTRCKQLNLTVLTVKVSTSSLVGSSSRGGDRRGRGGGRRRGSLLVRGRHHWLDTLRWGGEAHVHITVVWVLGWRVGAWVWLWLLFHRGHGRLWLRAVRPGAVFGGVRAVPHRRLRPAPENA